MENSRLVVRPLPASSARLGVTVLGLPGVRSGTFVRFRNGGREVVSRYVWLFGEGRPRAGEAWLDEWQRQDLAAEPGQAVEAAPLDSGEVPELLACDLAVGGAGDPDARELVHFMAAQRFPLYPGFRFEHAPP